MLATSNSPGPPPGAALSVGARFTALGEVFPVRRSVRRDLQVHVQPVQRCGTDLDLLAQDERHDLYAQRRVFEAQEVVAVEPFGVAELCWSQLDGEPGEHRQADVANDEVAPGRFLYRNGNSITEIVRVEKQDQRNRRNHYDPDDSTDQQE